LQYALIFSCLFLKVLVLTVLKCPQSKKTFTAGKYHRNDNDEKSSILHVDRISYMFVTAENFSVFDTLQF